MCAERDQSHQVLLTVFQQALLSIFSRPAHSQSLVEPPNLPDQQLTFHYFQ